MAEANAHYYNSRDPLGAAGDFTTAPEISQMFGELVGLWLADIWMRSGRKDNPLYVELGPGRGTLAADALRAMQMAALAPKVHFIETSEVLRAKQQANVPQAIWHDDLDGLPTAGPLLVVANEFFDALPVRQMVSTDHGWRERVVVRALDDEAGKFQPMAGYRPMDSAVPDSLRDAPKGAILESSPAGATVAYALALRIAKQGGAAILIDYGYEGPALGDTLQAVRGHKTANPFVDPGESDLTAHVDFTCLGNMARQAGLHVYGPVGQGRWLTALGIDARAEILAEKSPERAHDVESARSRLTADDQMGSLFKAMAFVHPDWASAEGFEG
ncbi:SAM-dependent methyltransferase [Rhizorhapis sp. SPR117]|uniref:class I SAM-dependent methyltransferase n=1 Tax=Rhizorhapis sp. SPR117 TaxID=2912611 RepID=UPI001F242698|nr:SAM-dependent methyltransferase [Rhizorhapis sp. SPR117]